MTTRLFIDWLSLTDPANPISGSRHLSLAFTRSINAWDIRDKFKDFAIEYNGIDASETTSFAALKAQSDAFLFDRRRDIVLDPSPEIIAQFLNEPRSSASSPEPMRRIGVALSSSGYVAVAIEHESATKQDTLLRDRAESIAALLVRLVGIAATGVAPQRGLEVIETEDRRTFLVSPHSIMPVAAVWHLPDNWSGDMKTAAEAALREKTLPGLAVRQEQSNSGFIEAGLVLNAIAQRFALASEQCIRQIERVTLSSEEAPQSTDRRPDPVADKDEALRRISDKQVTDGNAILRRISRIVWFSTLVLCSVFLILIFLPSTVLAPASPKHDTVPFLFTAFFVFSLFISWAIMDLERLFDHRPQALRTKVTQHSRSPIWNWLRWLRRKWPRALIARLIFFHPSVLGILVGVFLAFSLLIFWDKGELWGVSWDIGAFKGIRDYVGSLALLRSDRAGTFASILEGLVWALPALAIGVLKFSYDKLAGIVIGTQEDDRYQAFLEKLDPVLAAGSLYARQLENMLEKPSSGALDQAILNPVLAAKARYAGRLESQRDLFGGVRLPDFDNVRGRIALLKSHLAKAIEQAKTNFNRSAAFTAAMVAALAAIPGLDSIKPDSRGDSLAEAFRLGFKSEAVEGENNTCMLAVGDCNRNEQLAWTIGSAVREVKPPTIQVVVPDPPPLDDRLKGIIVEALKEGISWPTSDQIQPTISTAILAALEDERFADNQKLKDVITAGVIGALADESTVGLAVADAVDKGTQRAIVARLIVDQRFEGVVEKAILDALGDDWRKALKEQIVYPVLDETRRSLTDDEHAAVRTAVLKVLQDPQIAALMKQVLKPEVAGIPNPVTVNAEALANEILKEFREGSFPVLPDLPQDCRPDDRLVASVFFEQSGTSWRDASCVAVYTPGLTERRADASFSTRLSGGEDIAAHCEPLDPPSVKRDREADPRDRLWNGLLRVRAALPDTAKSLRVLVLGYTDSTGPVSSNIHISSDRAITVANFLRDRIESDETNPGLVVSPVGRSEVSLAHEFRGGRGSDAYQSPDARRAEIRLCYDLGKSNSAEAGTNSQQ